MASVQTARLLFILIDISLTTYIFQLINHLRITFRIFFNLKIMYYEKWKASDNKRSLIPHDNSVVKHKNNFNITCFPIPLINKIQTLNNFLIKFKKIKRHQKNKLRLVINTGKSVCRIRLNIIICHNFHHKNMKKIHTKSVSIYIYM